MPAPAANPDPTPPVVLFDGVCNLCNRCVRFIVKRDPKGYFRFASLQSETGRKLLAAHGLAPDRLDTIVLIEDGKVYTRSTAALRISRKLTGMVKLLSVYSIVYSPLRDWVYNIVAGNRYRWFGRTDTCPLPEPGLAERFLA